MCAIPSPPIPEYSTKMLLDQAVCGLNPGAIYLSTKVRRAEVGLTHPHFGLPKESASGWSRRVQLSALPETEARLLLAWATWLCLCHELSEPEDPTEVEIALLVSCMEDPSLMHSKEQIYAIAQFIETYYQHSLYWPFQHEAVLSTF